MRVAFLIQGGQGLYGAERATLLLIEGLREAGVEVEVLRLCERRLGVMGEDGVSRALKGRVVDIPVGGRFSRGAIRAIWAELAGWGAEVLHTTGYKADVHGGLAVEWGKRLPVVATVHGWLFRGDVKERVFQGVDLWALRRMTRVIVLSRFYENYLRARGFSPLQLARIPTGVRAEEVAKWGEAEGLWGEVGVPFTFGMLGRLSEEKGHGLFLRGAGRLARRMGGSPVPWRLRVAGEGALGGWIRRAAERAGVADRLEMAGRMDPGDFFRRTHVLVQCSRIENQPMGVMEAMAWGRPVIATGVGGLPELVEDGVTGKVLRDRSAGELAGAMGAYLLDMQRARMDGRCGRRAVEGGGAFERMVEDHLGVYDAACAGRGLWGGGGG